MQHSRLFMVHEEITLRETVSLDSWNVPAIFFGEDVTLSATLQRRRAYEPAGACWARITISSVVVPMISFARFNGTHTILPIESW